MPEGVRADRAAIRQGGQRDARRRGSECGRIRTIEPPRRGRADSGALASKAAMQKKIFWLSLAFFGLIADFTLPFIWAVLATLPIVVLSWWIAYRSGWF